MTHGAESAAAAKRGRFDVGRVRADFPILKRRVHGHPLVYLDNAATTQKPNAVLSAVRRYYTETCSNVHRGLHRLSVAATDDYEGARRNIAELIHAREPREIVFVRGTTEAINLVANSFAAGRIGSGDEILITGMEHHSNIVPWQLVAERVGAKIQVAPVDDTGELILEEYEKRLGPRTKLVAAVHVSNVLGTVNPVGRMIAMAHERGIPVLLDGAQAMAHERVDVQELDVDFYAFSSHKMFGPTGVGVLYGKSELLEAMPPWQGGGDMIRTVTFEKTTYNELPHKFEAGTPDIAGVIGLGAAVDYIRSLGHEDIARHEAELLAYGLEQLASVSRLRLIGTARHRTSVMSFVIDGIHPHDVATVLDMKGIAVRAGHHCSQPLMARFGVPATARASIAVYNTREDLDALRAGLVEVLEVLG